MYEFRNVDGGQQVGIPAVPRDTAAAAGAAGWPVEPVLRSRGARLSWHLKGPKHQGTNNRKQRDEKLKVQVCEKVTRQGSRLRSTHMPMVARGHPPIVAVVLHTARGQIWRDGIWTWPLTVRVSLVQRSPHSSTLPRTSVF